MTKPDVYTAHNADDPITIKYDDALRALENGTVLEEHGLMRWGSNYTFLVSVSHEDNTFLAIYKPRQGERPLWDFPDGTLCQRETAAYLVSAVLGWYIVPPTVMRSGSHGTGSVQIFINHDPQQHYFTFEECHEAQLQRIAAFDAIVNNADRKGGHCLLDESGRIWGIDHGLTFHVMHKLRTVIWDYAGQKIPDDLIPGIEALCQKLDDPDDACTLKLREMLSVPELTALRKRVDHLLLSRTYPLPGPGPNRPWPAV